MKTPEYLEVMDQLRQQYLKNFDNKCQTLREFFKQGDFSKLFLEYHKLKGSGSTYGCPEISLWGGKMEKLCSTQPHQISEIFEDSLTLLENIKNKYLHSRPFEMEKDKTYQKIVALT